MVLLTSLSLSLLALVPAVLGELEPHKPRHHPYHPRAHKLRTNSGDANATHTKRAPALRFPYGSTKVRGVNLGGWLVLEVSLSASVASAC
ncbi:hypothetical protein FRC08_015865 [Ceratobasidium sp. 394]|nr:hypothetical protein FRC08_015865 [Ceratobasidium sp. 394]